jgi:hypothetical protein
MRRNWIALLVIAAAACGWFGRHALGEDAPGGGMTSESDMEKMMTKLATPGENHAWLAAQEGEYDIVMTSYGPGGREESKATASVKMVLGGRFQEQRFKGTVHGKPFEGYGLTGYDNLKKEFVNYWFDTMGTAPSIAKGQRSADGKSTTLTGTWDMPGGGMPFTMVTTVTGEKSLTFKMTGTWQGQEAPMMEATYTKK